MTSQKYGNELAPHIRIVKVKRARCMMSLPHFTREKPAASVSNSVIDGVANAVITDVAMMLSDGYAV